MNWFLKRLLVTILTGLPAYAICQQRDLPLDPGVRVGKLANGFTYYIRHNEEPKNRVTLYLVNKVGSVLEDEDQRGLAHFMEHMSFNGTNHFPKNELVDYLQKSGIRFGADLNAYTSFDETVYQLPIPSDKPELLKGGLQILRDWAQGATLDSTEIDKERGVVLEEKRLGKGADERMERIYWPVVMNHSRYAERLPIGIDTVLNYFKPETIRKFYEDWYRPDLQALVVVGDIDVNQIEKKIKALFADLKNPSKKRLRTNYTIPLTGKNQFVAVTDPEMTATTAEILIKHPAMVLKTAADYRRALIRSLFNQMIAARLSELTLQAAPPFLSASAGINNFMRGIDAYDANVTVKPGELETGVKAVWRETERMKRFGFTASELNRSKKALMRQKETALKEKNKTSSEDLVNEYQQYFLLGTTAPGIAMEYSLTKQLLLGIGLAEVNQMSKMYITATNRDVVIQAPEMDENQLPAETQVNAWLNSIASENLQPYKDAVTQKPLLAHQPVAGKVVQETKELDLTRLTLSNGVKVVLMPTRFKNDEILFSAFAPGGTSLSDDADFQSAKNAALLIAAGGVGNYNAIKLKKHLQGKQLQVEPYIQERYQGFNGGATAKDLETSLQMIYGYFTEPRKDTDIFKSIIERSKAELADRANAPQAVFNDTISAVLGNYSSRKTGPSVAKLQQVNLNRAFKVYKDRFADAAGFTFTFVGSFTLAKIRPLLEKYLGALPATHTQEDYKDLNIHIPEGRMIKKVYKGTEPKANVLIAYSGSFDYSPENKVKIDALKEVLEIRLLQRLREEESSVYSPGVFINTSKYPKSRFSFYIQFGCAPEKVDNLVTSAVAEVAKLIKNGPPQENIDKWRAEEKNTTATQLKTNTFWLNYLTDQLQNKESISEINNYYQLLNKIKPSDIQATAAKYLDGKNYIQLELLPETSKK